MGPARERAEWTGFELGNNSILCLESDLTKICIPHGRDLRKHFNKPTAILLMLFGDISFALSILRKE